MPKYHVIFDSYHHYINQYECYSQGASPRILGFIESFLQENKNKISEIYLTLSQFNNESLNDLLKELAESGIPIHLISIPMDGYKDSDPVKLTNLVDGQAAYETEQSKFALARGIYGAHYKRPAANFKFYLFPHLAIRDTQLSPFDKGNMPYSLTTNSFLFVYKNGGGAVGLSSSNLDVGEIVKDNQMLLVEDDWQLLKNSLRFFKSLITYSFELDDFDFNAKYNHYKMLADKISLDKKGFFTTPFYYESSILAENYLAELIEKASKRILVMAPEITAYEYAINGQYHTNLENEKIENFGILRTVLERAALGVKVKCISAKVNEDAYSQQFLSILKATANVSFATNEMVNSRYLIIDDLLIVCTGNFNPSQFIYLDNVQIEEFEQMPNESYSGIYAIIGQYILNEDAATLSKYIQNFEEIWNRSNTQKITSN